MLAVAYLREILAYDRETGIFRWKVTKAGRYGKLLAVPGVRAGHTTRDGYWAVIVDGKCHMAHRLAWFYETGKWPVMMIDHVDGNKANNCWLNLREANPTQNAANSKVKNGSKSGFKGVYPYPSGGWAARISLNLGVFASPEEASAAYMAAARKLHGQFANPG